MRTGDYSIPIGSYHRGGDSGDSGASAASLISYIEKE
jgi:hypothetical protein